MLSRCDTLRARRDASMMAGRCESSQLALRSSRCAGCISCMAQGVHPIVSHRSAMRRPIVSLRPACESADHCRGLVVLLTRRVLGSNVLSLGDVTEVARCRRRERLRRTMQRTRRRGRFEKVRGARTAETAIRRGTESTTQDVTRVRSRADINVAIRRGLASLMRSPGRRAGLVFCVLCVSDLLERRGAGGFHREKRQVQIWTRSTGRSPVSCRISTSIVVGVATGALSMIGSSSGAGELLRDLNTVDILDP